MAKVAKDPAFLFYAQDFLTGTMFMTNEEVGIYIKLLCAQHQHNGVIKKNAFDALVGDKQAIREKFTEVEDGYFNERLELEIEKRANFTNHCRNNGKSGGRPKKEPKQNLLVTDSLPVGNPLQTDRVTQIEPIVNLREDENEIDNITNTTSLSNLDVDIVDIVDIVTTPINVNKYIPPGKYTDELMGVIIENVSEDERESRRIEQLPPEQQEIELKRMFCKKI